MPVKLSLSSLKQTHWHEYLIRFVLGGAATVLAGLIGKQFGTSVGGLFLALPAIFCASATLIDRHECRKKERVALNGGRRGPQAAALDAAGPGLGSIGLAAFAAVFYLTIPASVAVAFAVALVAWGTVAVSMWWLRRKLRVVRHQRQHDHASANRLAS
ncbi:DUF3147 family protein [Bradyrhizobium sp. Ec3.3]|uniref:DUF3147 family protein n=1 Tax=Bradyrhizobium sp. Ec3.3 TaxID=189753 RepID=UPI0003F9E79C|nr:DUF3147 family protein [Bradyrhizobium sp. Ec3.3]